MRRWQCACAQTVPGDAEFVFNGMVFLLLGLQLPGILETSLMAAEIDPNVEIWMLFTDIILIYAALMLVRFGWLWTMKSSATAS